MEMLLLETIELNRDADGTWWRRFEMIELIPDDVIVNS